MTDEKPCSVTNGDPDVEKHSDGTASGDSELMHVEDVEEFQWDLAVFLNIGALFSCYFASTWGLAVPNASIAFIVQRFPEGAGKSAWIAAAVIIPCCVFQAFMGELSDICGRKSFLLVGMVLALAGTIIAGRANNIEMVIGGQVLNGCGFTLGYLAIPSLAELIPKDRRPIIQGCAGIVAGLASFAGPIIQGAFIQHGVGGNLEGWRMSFYLAAAFYALSFVSVVVFYHPSPRPNMEGLSLAQRTLKIDWLGVFLMTAGLVLFLVGLQYGGNPYPWTDTVVLGPLIVGGVLIVVFILYGWWVRKDGILHHSLFRHRNYPIALATNFVGGIALFGGQAYLPQEIVTLFTDSAIMTGVYNLPFNIISTVSGLICGLIMAHTKEAKPIVVSAYGTLLLGSGLMAVMQPHINFAAWFFPTSLIGWAIGASMSILYTVVSICTPNQHIAHAMSLLAAVRAFGGSLGVVIFSQIFSTKENDIVPRKVSEAVLRAGLPSSRLQQLLTTVAGGSLKALLDIPGVTSEILEAFNKAEIQGLADSYRYIWYTFIPFAVVTLIISVFLKSTKAQMTKQVAAGIQRSR